MDSNSQQFGNLALQYFIFSGVLFAYPEGVGERLLKCFESMAEK